MDKTLAVMSFAAGFLAALLWTSSNTPKRNTRVSDNEQSSGKRDYLRIDQNMKQAAGQSL